MSTPSPSAIFRFPVTLDERDLYDLAFNVIEPQIEHLSGVASAQVIGGRIREIHVVVDREPSGGAPSARSVRHGCGREFQSDHPFR